MEDINQVHVIANINIPGILILTGNKVYGSYGPQKKQKYLYKFIPNDISLPYFLVPYHIPPSFSKKYINKYVIIQFKEWYEQNQTNKRPIGQIIINIGDVNVNENVYEYLMYCNHIKHSNKSLQLAIKQRLREKTSYEWIDFIINHYDMEDRRPQTTLHKYGFKHDIYSIDPIGSKDIDDAFSVRKISNTEYVLSIYIANVTIWIEVMNLWNHLSKRVASVYLPEEKVPMLPNIFSDDLCSLIQDETRFAFCMDITLCVHGDKTEHENIEIQNIDYKNVIVKLNDNIHYDDQHFLTSEVYNTVYRLTSLMNNQHKMGISYIKSGIHDSHDVIQYLMLFMNCQLASWCRERHIGIFRVLPNTICEKELDDVDEDIKPFLDIWNNVSGLYTTQKNMTTSYNELYKLKDLSHHQVGTQSYMHTTSPIRRIVDLINMSIIQSRMGFLKTDKHDSLVESFYIDHTDRDELSYINKQTRHIRHVQNESRLIHMVSSNPDILHKIHKGYVVDMTYKQDKIRYIVYIKELKLLKYMDICCMEEGFDNLVLYNSYYFKLSLFNDSHHIKRKIRINIHKDID